MKSPRPRLVRLTRHAADRCREYGRSPQEVADLVLAEHDRRERNSGDADWLLTGHGMVVAYDWPDERDRAVARVVTIWPRR